MQEGEPKNGYREQEAAGGTYAPKKVPELERQRQARIKRLQELERQQIELHKQRIINGTLSRRYNARAYDGLTAIVAFLTAVLLLWSAIGYVGRNAQLNAAQRTNDSVDRNGCYESCRRIMITVRHFYMLLSMQNRFTRSLHRGLA